MPITDPLQRFVDDELSRSAALADAAVQLTVAELQQAAAGASVEREQAHDVAQLLRKHSGQFVHTFVETLRSTVLADMHDAGAAPSQQANSLRGLELMDDTRLESDIEVASAAQIVLSAAEWELRELQTFTSTLAGQEHVSSDTNPLQPQAYARALWKAASELCPGSAQRTLLLRTAAAAMSSQLKKAWAAACTRLEAQGVEPGLYRTVVFAPGPKVERTPSFDPGHSGLMHGLLSRMPPGDAAASPATGTQAEPRGLEEALTRFQDLLDRAGANRTSSVPLPRISEHRAAFLAGSAQTVEAQVVELLSRVFDSLLADSRLPPPFRNVLGRLQGSVLRVALSDPAMLSTHDHAVWRLINRIGSAAETYTRTTDPRWVALLAYCDKLVDGIARAPAQDAPLYRLSLSRLDAFLAEQLREQQQRAQPSIDALTRAEQRRELEAQLADRLREQLQTVRLNAALRRFVCGVWSKVLAESMSRHGEKAEETLELLRTTDDLLWSLKLPDHPQSRKRLLAMLPTLLQKVRDGMTLIEVPAAEQQAVFDELMAVHTEALRPGSQPAQPELTPEQIVQRMRDETEWAPSSRLPFSDSLIDLGTMETVPADLLKEPVAEMDELARRVDAMSVGSRHHLFVQGRWSRVQLLWRSPHGQFFLFAGSDPARTHSLTRRALERLGEEGLLKPFDEVPLVQRAVDAVMLKLAPPA